MWNLRLKSLSALALSDWNVESPVSRPRVESRFRYISEYMEQHTVPQCYMRRDPGLDVRMGLHVWAVDLNRQIVRHKSPKSIAKLTDFDSIGLSADRVPKSHFEYLNCHASKPPPTLFCAVIAVTAQVPKTANAAKVLRSA